MLSETIAGLERVVGFYAAAGMSPVLSLEDCRTLLAAAKLSEARARVCEAAEDVSSSATMKADAGRGLICAVSRLSMRALKDALAALAAAEKGSA